MNIHNVILWKVFITILFYRHEDTIGVSARGKLACGIKKEVT